MGPKNVFLLVRYSYVEDSYIEVLLYILLTCYVAALASFAGIFFIYLAVILVQSSTPKQPSFTL
jgi:hypothetical protein